MPARQAPTAETGDMRPTPSEVTVSITDLDRGNLLRVKQGIIVQMGRVTEGSRPNTYTWKGTDDEEWELEPGEVVMFVGVLQDDDDALVVLARGQVGWVFIDEVDAV